MTDRVKIKEALHAVTTYKRENFKEPEDAWRALAIAIGAHLNVIEDTLRNASQADTKPAGGEWLPIESAPRDGSRILLTGWHGKDVKLWRGVGYGHFYKPGNRFEYDGYQFGNPDHQPTHWQPLPAPPLTRKENGE